MKTHARNRKGWFGWLKEGICILLVTGSTLEKSKYCNYAGCYMSSRRIAAACSYEKTLNVIKSRNCDEKEEAPANQPFLFAHIGVVANPQIHF